MSIPSAGPNTSGPSGPWSAGPAPIDANFPRTAQGPNYDHAGPSFR
jgi:hypothetical protein